MQGLAALWSWMKAHPVWAIIVFLIVIPFLLLGVFARVRSVVAGLPVVGPFAARIPDLGGGAP